MNAFVPNGYALKAYFGLSNFILYSFPSSFIMKSSPLVVVLLVEGSSLLVGVTSDVVDRNRCVQLHVKF